MSSEANWSDTPPEQVGCEVEEEANVECDARVLSSGLSDVVDGIDLHVGEDELLDTPRPSRSGSPVNFVVPVTQGALPLNLPNDMIAIDDRVQVPEVSTPDLTSNDLNSPPKTSDLTSNDLETKSTGSGSMMEVTLPPPTVPSTTSTTTTIAPTTTPMVIWTHTRPHVMANLQAHKPSLAKPVLLGPVSDYAASAVVVEKWKYVPNPDGVVRLPARVLEQHIRQRLTPTARTRLQMSAHRKTF